jgi:hypothetical protein
MGMSDFWMGIASAQNAVAGTKPADGRHRVLSIVGGVASVLACSLWLRSIANRSG